MLKEVFILLVPLIVGGILHMAAVTFDILPFLKISINEKLFGKNKTIRGFILMPILTIPGVMLAIKLEQLLNANIGMTNYHYLYLGTMLGLFYCLFELPNSFYKRLKGVQPGKMAADNKVFHAIVDQADSGFGLIIVYFFMSDAKVEHLVLFVILGTVIHLLINYLLYLCKLRKEPL